MSDSHSTTHSAAGKSARPTKPYPEFPLFPHAAGVWAKKIRGKFVYFGPWSDPDAALAKYLAEKDALHAGETPRPDAASVTVKDVVNAFLAHKQDKVNAGELSPRTWAKYKEVTDLIVKHLGKSRPALALRPDDFAKIKNVMAKRWGPLRIGDFVQHIRSVFKHAFDAELIDRPIRFGPGFERPSRTVLRRHRAKQGEKMYSADEVRRLLDAAGLPMRAMILLGLNAGYGNHDCATLPMTGIDWETGVIDFPRPKTGVRRRAFLWPETIAALREAQAKRPESKDPADAGLVFLSQRGTPLVSVRENDRTDAVAVQFGALLKRLGINGRKGLGFYTLRHVLETVGGEAKDQVALDAIMGHVDDSMAGHYRERIGDDRLQAVSDHVRTWLFGKATTTIIEPPTPASDNTAEGSRG